MNRTILQVPMDKELRVNAEKAAQSQGFSSLQEIVRIFLSQLSEDKLSVSIQTPAVKLSAKNEKRYLKMDDDIKKGKNVYHAKDVEELMLQLNSRK